MKIVPLGFTLSIFLAVTFTLCMIWGLLTPETLHMHTAWEGWLPGFNWSLGGYLVGLVWTVVYGCMRLLSLRRSIISFTGNLDHDERAPA